VVRSFEQTQRRPQLQARKIMPHIPVLLPDKAERDVLAVYDNFSARMSFPAPPNFILTQGHSRQTVRGTWDLVRNILVEGELPRWQKELVFVAISRDRNCGYCTRLWKNALYDGAVECGLGRDGRGGGLIDACGLSEVIRF
jgi:hypothetical protein